MRIFLTFSTFYVFILLVLSTPICSITRMLNFVILMLNFVTRMLNLVILMLNLVILMLNLVILMLNPITHCQQ